MAKKIFILLLIACITFPGCAVNPVTGRQELTLVSESQEIKLGQENYAPSRQMQGGDYTVDPELTAYVKSVGRRLAAVSDRPNLPYDFAVLNNSVPNAWALPGGKIAVNRGLLLELKNEAELAAVLGHEIVHAAARHGAKSMERGMLLQGVILATGIAARDSDYVNFVVGGAQIAAGLIYQKYSREAEREADYYGMLSMSRAGYDPRAAVSLQEVFVRLSEARNPNWLEGLFASHPPSRERVEDNRATASTLPAKGKLNTEQYQLKIARLKASKLGYKAHDEGRKALSKGKTGQALTLVKKAIKIEPGEATFYALKGDIHSKQRRYKDALKEYNKALELNDRFFYFFLRRGQAKEKLGDIQGARRDLENSISLLPTATAYNSLGNLYLAEGNRQKAAQYFKTAAGSKSEPGRQALRSLIRMDLPENPGNYLKVRLGLNNRRYVIAQVSNPNPLPVRNVQLRILYRDSQNQLRQAIRNVGGIIAPGKAALTSLGLGPISDTNALKNIRVQVIRARIAE
ncbi:MAG: M48 family metalloprotease [Deltaproteobacteria bacterium]|nr:M48 family metalloprotease [Deltaproteobacteria bacterium]MBW2051133.1 M48 family metalloprotease [Deltaproteobacteria bacterium]MBW2140729.1 M48 family metalloprotease [Deltaproteobacteria bacterium]